MNVRVFVIACLLGNDVVACTYDETDQLVKLRALVKSVDGGYLNEDTREATWTNTNGEKYSVIYGGCDHLGHRITVTQTGKVLPSEPELFRIAQQLADEYWRGGEGELLRHALESRQFTREASNFRVRFDVTGTDYSEMYFESRQEGETTMIVLGWVRNF